MIEHSAARSIRIEADKHPRSAQSGSVILYSFYGGGDENLVRCSRPVMETLPHTPDAIYKAIVCKELPIENA